MIAVSVNELERLSQLPFDIYNKDGRIILRAGEMMTPSRLLQFRYLELFRKTSAERPKTIPQQSLNKLVSLKQKQQTKNTHQEYIPQQADRLEEINEDCLFRQHTQVEIKKANHEIIDRMTQGLIPDPSLYFQTRDTIVASVLECVDKVTFLNELRIFDDYDYSHGINVAILSVFLGCKLGISQANLSVLSLGALLHDIGKVRIPKKIVNKKGPLTAKEYEIVKLHAPLGYKILKDELFMPDEVAKIALEHQERFDGTGYPKGVSGMDIDKYSQIVAICDVYDALVTTKAYSSEKPSHEATKIMLNYGSRWFNPGYLYKFVHMASS